ncbi:MAG: hypothetical protein ACLR0U_22030 [Enterocloster clostridioformis]
MFILILKAVLSAASFTPGAVSFPLSSCGRNNQIGFHTARNVTARLREEGILSPETERRQWSVGKAACLPPIQPFVRYCPTGAACWSCTNPLTVILPPLLTLCFTIL